MTIRIAPVILGYTAGGIFFGLMFPVVAWVLEIFLDDLPLAFNTIIQLHQDNVIHYIVDCAPAVLGVVFYFIGRKQATILRHSDELEIIIANRTAELLDTNLSLQNEIAQRQRVEGVKQEFVSTISHELRTPLTAIKGSLGLVRSGALGELTEKIESLIDISYSNSDRLLRLINDILDIDKIAVGKMDFKIAPINLDSLLKRSIEVNKGYAETHGVSLVMTESIPSANVNADEDRLMQVFDNLLSNAIKFSTERKLVEISLIRLESGFRVQVRDHGDGISETFQDKVFERFTQADSSTTRRKGGSGLGLSITKAIVEQLGGNIGFQTEIGKGTLFYVDLPELH